LNDDVAGELKLVNESDVVVLVYPIWFGMPPAIISGYITRVLGAGLTMQSIRANEPQEELSRKQLVFLTTSGSTKPWLSERGQWHGLKEAFDFYLKSIFSFADCSHEHFDAIVSPLSPRYAEECFSRTAEAARLICSTALSAAHDRQKQSRIS
jgi:NAD(P)H dehydrogenase (quinone)